MTQEDKELLLKDLSARQIYGVKALISSLWNKDKESEECITDSIYCVMRDGYVNTDTIDSDIPIENVKPYLRPLSSMTEDEKAELLSLVNEETRIICEQIKNNNCGIEEGKYHFNHLLELDWLNAHYFDYRGLIEKGLALEAKDGMYLLKK